MADKKIGLALGAGGAAGMAHIGVLQALEELQIRPDIIVGSSIGAVIGGAYALEPDVNNLKEKIGDFLSSEKIIKKWQEISLEDNDDTKKTFQHEIVDFINRQLIGLKVLNRISLRPASELIDLLTSLFDELGVQDTKIKFGAVALDLIAGKEILFQEGLMRDIVYASAAIPGIFPPLEYNDYLLVDGGFTSNCPIQFAKSLGADYVIAVTVATPLVEDTTFDFGVEVLTRTDEVVRKKLAKTETNEADILIHPDVGDIHWADFESWENLAELGYRETMLNKDDLNNLKRKVKSGLFEDFWVKLFK